MAEACRQRNLRCSESNAVDNNQSENFCVFNVLCVFISLITILADLTTDVIVFVEYYKDGFLYWGLSTLIFILTPNIIINIFSMRWFIIDQKANLRHWISHGCLTGLLQRYVVFLRNVYVCQSFEAIKTQKLTSEKNDISLLHFLYIFTGTVPQIILQTYSVLTLDGNNYTKVFALAASNASVIWGCSTYIYSIMAYSDVNFQWISFTLRLVWHFSMLVARVWGVVLFTLIFGIWVLLPLGLHWTAMTFWIMIQSTTFCPNKFEETLYNIVMGFVYCFCYINLREGHTRYRLMMFYTFMVTQNFGSLFLYVILPDPDRLIKPWSIGATIFIIAGTVLGLCAMICYYRYFHSKGPILWKNTNNDVELNNKIGADKNNAVKHCRSFKTTEKPVMQYNNTNARIEMLNPERVCQNESTKTFLENLAAKTGSPTASSVPVGYFYMNSSISDDKHPKTKSDKNVTICPPTELALKLSSLENIESSIDEITVNNMRKRRGLYSSDGHGDELNDLNLEAYNRINEALNRIKTDHKSESHDHDGSNKQTSTDSIDMDLDLSFSDINSTDINTFNENIVQKLCLSALKNIKVGNQDADIENIQRIAVDILKEMHDKKGKTVHGANANVFLTKQRDLDTPTELLSVHDYENICAVNIAREAWGLRSWNGYTDIENWLHDGSVVRDTRRDTLTSASTEISSCTSQELKNAIMSVTPFTKRAPTYSNVFVKFERSLDDYVNTSYTDFNYDTYLSKPCMVENKDSIQLEPIMEELDDLGAIDPFMNKLKSSESSLVATIDEIRKTTVANSPKNIDHRPHIWCSHHSPSKLDNRLKTALWKEPSKFDSSNIMKWLPDKDMRDHTSKLDENKKKSSALYKGNMPSSENVQSLSDFGRSTKTQHKNTTQIKHQNKKPEQGQRDLSNKDFDLLWQMVTENSLPINSTEDLHSANKMSSSLQSLIHNDTFAENSTSLSKSFNVKRGLKSKPKRKFMILKERLEPRPNCTDEEVLYKSSKSRYNSGLDNVMKSIGKDDEQYWQPPTINVINEQFPHGSKVIFRNMHEKQSVAVKQALAHQNQVHTKFRI